MKTLFTNINQLVQVRAKHIPKINGLEMNKLPILENAYLIIKNGLIEDYGQMQNLPENFNGEVNDLKGKIVLPTWNDSHTHLVYAEPRANEFVDRLNGLSYEDIAKKGGGILNSAKALSKLSENALFEEASKRLNQAISMGTGAIEIKSGYGLDVENEIKMLKVINNLKLISPIPIKRTLLAAHAIPIKYKNNKSEYIKIITNELIPRVARENLADYIDVFCEKGYFTVSETDKILNYGVSYGLIPKVHTNQFNIIGGVKAAINYNALSVDHLELLDNNDIEALKYSNTMCTTLPACSFFLGIPYAPVRLMMKNNLAVALASDFNPGSSPTNNMNFVVSLACIKMKMTPEEAINAATINGACAMGVSDQLGSISIGKKANLIITKPLNHYYEIPYNFGNNIIEQVIINGNKQKS